MIERANVFFHVLNASVTEAKPTETTPIATPIVIVTTSFRKLCTFTLSAPYLG